MQEKGTKYAYWLGAMALVTVAVLLPQTTLSPVLYQPLLLILTISYFYVGITIFSGSPLIQRFTQSMSRRLSARRRIGKYIKELKKPAPVTKESDDEFKPRVEFLLGNRDVNAEEYDHLAAVAMRNSGSITLESLQGAKESEKGYISFLRKQSANKSKNPGSTSASAASKFEKSADEISKMSRDEHMAYEQQLMKNQTGVI